MIVECKVHAKNESSLQDNRRYWKSSDCFSCMRVKGKTREKRKDVFCFLFPFSRGSGAYSETQGQIVWGKGKTPLPIPWSQSMFYFVRS